ncbi:hypothetical protein [Spirobacillus cienkowskii]|jgi:hypothetical protein|uniref:PilZ domain-containing protein n=1 Tax=Spirobacillus cienkowskii TaxID=495820 RepID=A0A369KR19_9BACT|nr:MAG: hypothetical protein DCC88_01865 [Spirobacillus cienkowskii]
MQKNLTLDDIEDINHVGATAEVKPTTFDLKLISTKIPIKYCEYKISNNVNKMLKSETSAISTKGILFQVQLEFKVGSLLRVWVEIPDYWVRKSKIVEYRHTAAPTYFQVLCRVLNVEELLKKGAKYQILTEILSLDSVDETVLIEYLKNCGTNYK